MHFSPILVLSGVYFSFQQLHLPVIKVPAQNPTAQPNQGIVTKKALKHRQHKRQQEGFQEKFQTNLDYKDKFLLIFLRPQLHLQFWADFHWIFSQQVE